MNHGNLAILTLFVFAYSAMGGRADRTPNEATLVYTLFGLEMSAHGLGFLNLSVESEEAPNGDSRK